MQSAHASLCADARPWLGSAALLGVLPGTALQLQQAELWLLRSYGVCIGLGFGMALGLLAVCLRTCAGGRQRQWIRALVMALATASLVFGLAGWRSLDYLSTALLPEWEGQDVLVRGTIVALPQVRENGLRLRMEVQEASALDGEVVALPPLIDISWFSRGPFDAPGNEVVLPPVRAGERWQFTVRLKAPHGALNPHGFDYELWAWEQGVQASGYVRTSRTAVEPERLEPARWWRYPVEQVRQRVRDAMMERLVWSDPRADARGVRAAGLLVALVVGEQRAITREDWDVFRITGIAHLVSISGLHVTMFAWLAAGIVGAAWRRSARLCLWLPAPVASLLGGVLLATLYALFSGWGVPAQRTIFMLAMVGLLRLSGRQWPWPHVWLFTCALVLLVDPWAMLQAGFWLSFVAVGILFASGDLERQGEHLVVHHLLLQMRQQWVVTLAITPLTLLLFGQISLVSMAANMLAIPWVTLLVLPLAFAGVLVPALLPLAQWSAYWMIVVLQWMATLPWAQLTLPLAPLWVGMVAALGGVLLAMRWPWQVRLLALPLVLPALWWTHPRPETGRFELLAADVGQGQAVLVRTANRSLLYDTGPRFSQDSDAGERVLVPLLRGLGERLDMVVLSHRDTDHTGGAESVMRQQPQAQLVASVEGAHRLASAPAFTACEEGQSWHWDGVRFDVLHPTQEMARQLAVQPPAVPLKPNQVSCVLRVRDREGRSVLLAGDIEAPQERALLARGQVAPADVLLVPHHGSKTSSSGPFLDALQPRIAIVQAGYRNRYGHPAPSVMARYMERGIQVVETPGCGAVRWASALPERVGCERARVRRYWHHRLPTDSPD